MTACSRAPASCAATSSRTRYRALVDAMYDGRTEVRFEPGSGEEATDVKIRDAKVVASAQTRRAA